MPKNKIIIAAHNNKKAWEKADLICDGIDDQVEIQHGIDLALKLGRKFRFTKGIYNISKPIIFPENQ